MIIASRLAAAGRRLAASRTALALGLAVLSAGPAAGEILSVEQLTPWTTRYVVQGTSSFVQGPSTIRFAGGNAVTVTATLQAIPLDAPASLTLRDGCVVIPHPFTPVHPCTDPPPFPSSQGLALTTLGGPVIVANPFVPTTVSFEALGPGQISFTVSPGATADLVVTIDPPRPSFLSKAVKDGLSAAADNIAVWNASAAVMALLCNAIPTMPPMPPAPPIDVTLKSVCVTATMSVMSVGHLTALGLRAIATDPVDPDYATVVAVLIPSPTPMASGQGVVDGAVNAFAATGAELVGFADAVLISINRFSGAVAAGDAGAEARQATAVVQYLQQLQARVAAYPGLLSAVASALAAIGFPAVVITPDMARHARLDMLAHGLPAEVRHEMTSLGATTAAMEESRLLTLTRDPDRVARVFPGEWPRADEVAEVVGLAALLPAPPAPPRRTMCLGVGDPGGVPVRMGQVPCPTTPVLGPAGQSPYKTVVYFGWGDRVSSLGEPHCSVADVDGDGRIDAVCDSYTAP